MTVHAPGTRKAVFAAVCAATAMIANHVGGKAARDALFLSYYPVTALPAIWIASAVLSIVVAMVVSLRIGRRGPSAFVPTAFLASGGLYFLEWIIAHRSPRIAAAMVVPHTAVFGSILVSGFWSLVAERFDPRTARRQIGRIAAGAALGGLLGGILAERISAWAGVRATFPLLAVLHLVAGWAVRGVRTGPQRHDEARLDESARPRLGAGLAIVRSTPYLRHLAALVLVQTVAATLLDYAFKTRAAATYPSGHELVRFFALFHTSVALAAVIVQSSLTTTLLARFGLGNTLGLFPVTVAAAAGAAAAMPTLAPVALARGTEMSLRNSVFRSGYELLFSPLPTSERRATKPLIDVVAEKLGDIFGAASIQLFLVLQLTMRLPILLVGSAALALVGLGITMRLRTGWRGALERSLLDLAPSPAGEGPDRSILGDSMLLSIGAIDLTRASSTLRLPPSEMTSAEISALVFRLGQDAPSREAMKTLLRHARAFDGDLVLHLRSENVNPSARARIPRLLLEAGTPRALEALVAGLFDARFDVRFQCGRALTRLVDRSPAVALDRSRIEEAIVHEAAVSKHVWSTRDLLTEDAGEEGSPFERALRRRSTRSLEHVFALLSLLLPREPLLVAYRGLHTKDAVLRGTALEYLEVALPPRVKEAVWPHLDDDPKRRRETRSREDVLADLLRSNESIVLSLDALREATDDRS